MNSKNPKIIDILFPYSRYGIPLWQSPQFLFLVMGIIIIVAIVSSYQIGARYVQDPEMIVLIVLGVTAVLVVLAFSVVRSFERLAEANRMKSEFISVVSHQLRSPLSNLRWAIELLMSGRLGKIEEKQTEYFRILKENSARMQELISDLLIISRLETRTLPVKKNEVFLEDLIKNSIKSFELFAKASNIEIEFQAEENLPKIVTDPEHLRLVIDNLIDNAIRYMKEKGKIKIKLDKRKGDLYLEISDTGVGIPKEDQKYIFQKFFRSENILRYQTQGSGLGLYIAKSIIERLGGKIGFKSQEGKGSTFWFTLPIK